MTRTTDCTLSPELVELLADQGLEALPELIRLIINAAIQAECHRHLHAASYERTPERRGYSNGYKPKTITPCVNPVTFSASRSMHLSGTKRCLSHLSTHEPAFSNRQHSNNWHT